jgi:hypothetical protein
MIHCSNRPSDGAAAHREGDAPRERPTVLDEEGHSAKGPVRVVFEGPVEQRLGERVEVRVHGFDGTAGDRFHF